MGLWNNYLTTFLPVAVKLQGPSSHPQTGSVHQAPFPMALLPRPPLREKLDRLVLSHQAALLLSATSQGNMKTETQVVRGAFVWDRGAVVRGKPTANLHTKELPVPLLL